MKQQDYLEIIEQNRGKHRLSLETLIQGRRNELFNEKPVETKLIAIYNVEDTSEPTSLFVGVERMGFPASTIYDKIEIDNVEINISDLLSEQEFITIYSYAFERSGQHTVKYTLKDPTIIGAEINEEFTPLKVGATFMNCDSLTNIIIPDSVTYIGDGAFNGCSGLIDVTIPNSVTSIGNNAFYNCNLTSITVDSSNTVYDSRNNCNAIIETSTNKLIVGCQNTVIPNNVTSIGIIAFGYCSNLTEIIIPDSIISIGDGAFEYCHSLTNVTIESVVPPTVNSEYLPFNGTDCSIYVPSQSVETYKTATGWSKYVSRIQAIPTE